MYSGGGPARTPLNSRRGMGRRRSERLSTSTVGSTGHLVPWLAAEGPLAYCPEKPPEHDYYFQYGWVLPGILSEHANARRHYIFGAQRRDDATDLLAFWKRARDGDAEGVARCLGTIEVDAVTAPVAVYRTSSTWRGPAYLLMQHGSYQIVEVADQPLLDAGEAVLYRGVQESPAFRSSRIGDLDAAKRQTWRRYLAVQAHVLSDATRSFNSIHDRAKRSETEHIRDRSWMTDDIARQYGLDIGRAGFAQALWDATHQSFALARWVAEHKFGPRYVICKTPLGNIRMTSFFAGEHEARIIDPSRVDILEAHGCRVVPTDC